MTPCRFPSPWTIDEANNACFIVCDYTGQALGYFYFEDEPGRRCIALRCSNMSEVGGANRKDPAHARYDAIDPMRPLAS